MKKIDFKIPLKRGDLEDAADFIKSIFERDKSSVKYENETAIAYHSKDGFYYYCKLYPQDFTFFTGKIIKKKLTDEEFNEFIEKVISKQKDANSNNADIYYYGLVYEDESFFESHINMKTNKEEIAGAKKNELPCSTKIKIYSKNETVFDNGVKKGVIVIMRMAKDKNIFFQISHDNLDISIS